MKFKLTALERKKYLMPEERDWIILKKIKKLEEKKLSKEDKLLVKLIKTQLEKDWRKPLIIKLDKLSKKYKK